MRETRSIYCDVRAESSKARGHYLIGIPIVFNSRTNLGWADEIIEDGALTSAALKDVRFLVNHDMDSLPLARRKDGSKDNTMSLRIIPRVGLEITVDLDTENNTEARNLYSAVKRRDVTGMSFAFNVDQDDWEGLETDHPTRHIRKISRVWEVSAVTFPAYEATSITARNKRGEAMESRNQHKERLKTMIDEGRTKKMDSLSALIHTKKQLLELWEEIRKEKDQRKLIELRAKERNLSDRYKKIQSMSNAKSRKAERAIIEETQK